MNSQEMYEALLAHLAHVSEEELAHDWEMLKEFNCGVSISEYLGSITSISELGTTKVTSKYDDAYASLNNEVPDFAFAA